MTAAQEFTGRTQAALQYLQRLKPLDGYAVECYRESNGKQLVRLKRRNIPLRDSGFLDIVVVRCAVGRYEGGCVVGIQDMSSKFDVGRGVVLVDKNGSICSDDDSPVTVQMANVLSTSASSLDSATRCYSSLLKYQPSMTANNELLLQYGLMALGALVLLKLIFAIMNVLALVLLPFAYFYALHSCPSNDTFDGKRELKRVMRG